VSFFPLDVLGHGTILLRTFLRAAPPPAPFELLSSPKEASHGPRPPLMPQARAQRQRNVEETSSKATHRRPGRVAHPSACTTKRWVPQTSRLCSAGPRRQARLT